MAEYNREPVTAYGTGAVGGAGADGGAALTGDVQVDEALMALQRLDELPVHDHPAVFDTAHRVLQDRLAADDQADSGQGG